MGVALKALFSKSFCNTTMKTTTLRTTEMDVETVLAAASTIPKDQPIIMVNLLRYKRADECHTGWKTQQQRKKERQQ